MNYNVEKASNYPVLNPLEERHLIGAGVSEPYTSELNSGFPLIYIYIYVSYVIRCSVYF